MSNILDFRPPCPSRRHVPAFEEVIAKRSVQWGDWLNERLVAQNPDGAEDMRALSSGLEIIHAVAAAIPVRLNVLDKSCEPLQKRTWLDLCADLSDLVDEVGRVLPIIGQLSRSVPDASDSIEDQVPVGI